MFAGRDVDRLYAGSAAQNRAMVSFCRGDERLLPVRLDGEVKDVQRVDGLDAFHHVDLTHAVERSGGEAAGIDVAALIHEGLELLVVGLLAGEGLVAHAGVPAGRCGDEGARSVEHDGGVESLAVDAGAGEQVDEAHRPFERDGVEKDVGSLTFLCLVIRKDLLFVIDDRVARLDPLSNDLDHLDSLSSRLPSVLPSGSTSRLVAGFPVEPMSPSTNSSPAVHQGDGSEGGGARPFHEGR